MAPGTYQLRLFRDDGYTKLATSNTFTVTSGTLAAVRGPVLRHADARGHRGEFLQREKSFEPQDRLLEEAP